jgi:MFS family permease
VSAAASVERELGLSHTGYAAFVFAGPLVLAAAIESAIALRSDGWDRRRVILGGQGVLAAALIVAGWTRNPWVLGVALAMAGASSGAACGAAQALLVANDPHGPERAMVRWTWWASVGDALAPLVAAAAIAMGASYRGALVFVGAVVGVPCVVAAVRGRAARDGGSGTASRSDADAPESTPPERMADALSRALTNPRLWAWLSAAAMCTLLDEIVVALATLRLQRNAGITESLAAASAIAFSSGAVAGATVADRAVERFGGRSVLLASGAACLAAIAIVVPSHALLPTCAALFVLGAACAPHHALAMASAYAEMPGNPGTVQALAQLFVAVDIGAPLALGAIADRYGLDAALSCLALQPAVLVACAFGLSRRRDGAP